MIDADGFPSGSSPAVASLVEETSFSEHRADEVWAQGVLEFRAGEHGKGLREVLRLMQQSLEIHGADPGRQYFVGVLLIMKNSIEEAKTCFEEAITLVGCLLVEGSGVFLFVGFGFLTYLQRTLGRY